MAIDELIASGIRPPQVDDPTTTYGKLLAIRGQQEQLRSLQQENQQRQLQMDQTKATNDAYRNALTIGQDGTPQIDSGKLTQALSSAGHGSAIPGILKNLNDYKKASADLQKTQGEVAGQEADFAGALGNTVRSAKYDPHLFLTLAQHAVDTKHVDPGVVAPLLNQVNQAMQQDPTGEAARQVVQQISDHFIAGSPAQQKLEAERVTAQAHQQTAQTASEKQANEAPGQKAQAEQLARANAAAQLANAPDQATYAQMLDAMPHGIARVFPAAEQFDLAKTPAVVRRLGMTAEQQTQADQAAANAGETSRHNRTEEGQGAQRINIEGGQLGVARGRLGLEQKRFDATLGAGLDASGKPLSADELKAAAQADPIAKLIASYQMVGPTARNAADPKTAFLMRKVTALNPDYEVGAAPARVATQRDFSASGNSGKALTSADTALAHLDTISRAGEALRNSDFKVLNRIANEIGAQTGSSARNTYDTIVAMVAPEISKAVIGAAGGEGERQAMAHNFGSDVNDQTREQAIGAAAQLLGARVQKQLHAYEQTMGKPATWTFSPESARILQRYGASAPAAAGGTAAKQAAAPAYKVGDPVMYNGAPHKIIEIKPNGKLVLEQ